MNVKFQGNLFRKKFRMQQHLIFLMVYICVLSFSCKTSRNACGDCEFGQRVNIPAAQALGIGGCPNCDRATSALKNFEESLIAKDSVEALNIERLHRRPVNPKATIGLNHAQEYINRFTRHCPFVRLFMGRNYRNSFLFDTATLGAFASLYCQGKIDGIRAYVAKYDRNRDDPKADTANHFTIILVGTKRVKYWDAQKKDSLYMYKDTLIPTTRKVNVFSDLQDYSNPCKPTPCPGATLPTMKLEFINTKR